MGLHPGIPLASRLLVPVTAQKEPPGVDISPKCHLPVDLKGL
jgi:hypothetical protein